MVQPSFAAAERAFLFGNLKDIPGVNMEVPPFVIAPCRIAFLENYHLEIRNPAGPEVTASLFRNRRTRQLFLRLLTIDAEATLDVSNAPKQASRQWVEITNPAAEYNETKFREYCQERGIDFEEGLFAAAMAMHETAFNIELSSSLLLY